MPGVLLENPFAVDWTDLEAVKGFCARLSKVSDEALVITHNGMNYNITHASRTDLLKSKKVVATYYKGEARP